MDVVVCHSSAVCLAVADHDQSNAGAEGSTAFLILVNFLSKWQGVQFRLAQLAIPLLICSAQWIAHGL